MATTADYTQFRAEMVAKNEEKLSPLRAACVTEYMDQGGSAVFLVGGSIDEAVERGVDGDIPYSPDDYIQNTATLKAVYAPWAKTGFDIFKAQSDLKRKAQETIVYRLNRNITRTIRDALSATSTTASAQTASLSWVEDQIATLASNAVDVEEIENMYAWVSPRVMARLRQIPEFASADYVDVKTHAGTIKRQLRWNGLNWIQSSLVKNLNTATEEVYVFHRNGIGHAANMKDMKINVGYNGEQDRSYCNASLFHGAKLLQSSHVIKATHDAS